MITKFYLTCIFLFAICITKGQQAADMNKTADSLFLAGQYFEAAIQYERVLFSAEDTSQVRHAVFGKLQCLKQQGLFKEAVRFINASRTDNLPDHLNYKLYYEQMLCAYLGGNFENALAIIEQAKLNFPDAAAEPSVDAIKIMSLNELRRWEEAAEVYASFVSKTGIPAPEADLYKKIPALKSVDKAGWLSTFIPGGGQFYAGRPLEGVLSILIQGAGIYYGIISFQEKYYLSAWLVGAGIFGSFHMGSVRRSEALVNQYNKKKAYEFNSKVRKDILKNLGDR